MYAKLAKTMLLRIPWKDIKSSKTRTPMMRPVPLPSHLKCEATRARKRSQDISPPKTMAASWKKAKAQSPIAHHQTHIQAMLLFRDRRNEGATTYIYIHIYRYPHTLTELKKSDVYIYARSPSVTFRPSVQNLSWNNCRGPFMKKIPQTSRNQKALLSLVGEQHLPVLPHPGCEIGPRRPYPNQ